MSLHDLTWTSSHIFVPMPVSEIWSRLGKIRLCNTKKFPVAAFLDNLSPIGVVLRDRFHSGVLGTDLLFIWPISVAVNWNALIKCTNPAFNAFYNSIELVASEIPCPHDDCNHLSTAIYPNLSDVQREVIDLKIEGKTNKEIAEYLSIGEGAVEKRIQRIEPNTKQILIDAGIVKR